MLTLDNVGVRFGDKVAVAKVSLELPEGEVLAVLGPSGCGKSTLLRAIAGLEELDAFLAIPQEQVPDPTRAKAALGTRFDVRDFNQAVLAGGNVPLDVLTGNVTRYIAASRG